VRYGFLLILLITSYLLSAFLSAKWINDSLTLLFTATILLAMRNLQLHRAARLALEAGLIASVLVIVVAAEEGGNPGRGAAALWAGCLLLATVVLILRQILLMPSVTVQSIYGAISAYLIIGLMFAQFYSAMWWFSGYFFAQGSHVAGLSDFQYFSFTTLTTLGYGDFTATAAAGRAVAMIEAMSGQIFLATLVARLVASFRPAASTGDAAGDGNS